MSPCLQERGESANRLSGPGDGASNVLAEGVNSLDAGEVALVQHLDLEFGQVVVACK